MHKDLYLQVSAHQLLGMRDNQEDAYAISSPDVFAQKGLLCVLADGIGGMEDGEIYSQTAVQLMQEAFLELDPTENVCDDLHTLYQLTRQRLLQQHRVEQQEKGGATLVAVLIRGDECAFVSAGDSVIDLFRGGGNIRLNRSQIMSVKLDERAALGHIPWELALLNSSRSVLLNHVCSAREVSCDLSSAPISLQPGDWLMLASDGVTSAISEEEIALALRNANEHAARAIIEMVYQQNCPKQDNATAILIEIVS